MSTLYLVRHAQASFMSADYDVLSDLGRDQARQLGERWARLGIPLDAVYTGPRRRQRHTAEIVGEAMREAGHPWPDPVVLGDLDEYQAEPMMTRFVPTLAARHPEVRELTEALSQTQDRHGQARQFERLFQTVMHLWADEAFGAPDVETFAAFRGRAERALCTVTEEPSGRRRVAVFSSGGAIGSAVGSVLGLGGRTMLELGWTLNNCGVCEILFTPGRRSLSRYNDIAHLADPALWTYR